MCVILLVRTSEVFFQLFDQGIVGIERRRRFCFSLGLDSFGWINHRFDQDEEVPGFLSFGRAVEKPPD